MYSEGYVRLILALAPFVVCLALALDPYWKRRSLWLGCALLFSASVLLPQARIWACLPWLAMTLALAFSSLRRFVRNPHLQLPELSILASTLYLPVGGVWALFDQTNFQPLGFSGLIVLLTGVHFHYAGFALPRLTGLWLTQQPQKVLFKTATWGVIAGVPLVAIGITTSINTS